MGLKVYLDGQLVPTEEAKISIFDHGFLYGDGVFEGIRSYNGRVFKLKEHLDRLYESARAIMLKIPLHREGMEKTVLEILRANNLNDAYVRLVVSRGIGDLGLDPRKCSRPTVLIIADKIELYPEKFYRDGLELITAATRRVAPEALNPMVKSLNYLNNILAKIEAIKAGLPEALMLTSGGYVAECSGDNIFIVKDDILITPPVHVGILVGITRNVVMEITRDAGMEVVEKVFTGHDVYNAEECFLTGTAAEIIPVVKLDGRTIGDGKPGKVTQELMRKFKELTAKEGTPV